MALKNGTREEMLTDLADVIDRARPAHPLRVAIDGRPAAGKTVLGAELANVLQSRGRFVIRTDIERFLRPRAERYRRGVDSPEGCYHDSFDFDALHRLLLDPLGPDGNRRFQDAAYDKVTDMTVSPPVITAPPDAVLLFDGVFLLRPELIESWDLCILVSATFEETLNRARTRDLASLGSTERVEERFRNRYLPSQQHYFDTVRPAELADVVLHNDGPHHPRWELPRAVQSDQ